VTAGCTDAPQPSTGYAVGAFEASAIACTASRSMVGATRAIFANLLLPGGPCPNASWNRHGDMPHVTWVADRVITWFEFNIYASIQYIRWPRGKGAGLYVLHILDESLPKDRAGRVSVSSHLHDRAARRTCGAPLCQKSSRHRNEVMRAVSCEILKELPGCPNRALGVQGIREANPHSYGAMRELQWRLPA
jgi:hypothetical protein